MSKSAKRVLKNSFFQTLGAFAITGLNLLLMLGYARLLGPESFGILISAQAKVLLCALFVDLGLSQGLISVLTLAEGKKSDLIRQGFRARDIILRVLLVRLSGALIGTSVIVWSAWIKYGNASTEFWLEIAFTPSLFALAIQQTAVAVANFRGRQGYAVFANISGIFLTVALSLYLAFRGYSISYLLLSQSWGGFLTGFIIFLFLFVGKKQKIYTTRRQEKTWMGPWVKEAWKAILKDAWPYAITFAVFVFWSRLDQLAALKILGAEAAGQYALAVRLVVIPIFVASSISLALFPDVQRLGRDNPARVAMILGALLKAVYRFGVIAVVLIIGMMILVVHPLVPKYDSALKILPYFAPGIWSFWMQGFIINSLQGVRQFRRVVSLHLISLSLYLPALYFLPRFLGLQGIVWSFNLFCLSMFILGYLAAKRSDLLPKTFSLFDKFTSEEITLWEKAEFRLLGRKIKVGK